MKKKKRKRHLAQKHLIKWAGRLTSLIMCFLQLPMAVYADTQQGEEYVTSEIYENIEAADEDDVIIVDDIGTVALEEDAYDEIIEEVCPEDNADVIYEDPEVNTYDTFKGDVISEAEDVIYVDDPEKIPIGQDKTVIVDIPDEAPSIFEVETDSIWSGYDATSEEVILLAKLIHHEAGDQPRAGKIAVGEVVMNRVSSDRFANTIERVIYSPGQFAENHEIAYMHPTEEEYEIAEDVIAGTEKIFDNPDVLFFKNPTITSSGRYNSDDVVDWGRYEWYCYIGDHAFYTL